MPIPQIKVAFNGWESPISLVKITKTIVDFEPVETTETLEFKGVVQPLTPEALKRKPLESRSWVWLMIHTKTAIELNTGDLIIRDGKRFEVEFKNDFELYNYFEYHLVEDFA